MFTGRAPKMAVIRRLKPPEALFYDACRKLKVKFIFASQKPAPYPVKTHNLELVNLLFRPKYLIDPAALLNRGIYTNRSWVEIQDLAAQLEDVAVVNISDTFYFWSAQEARLAKRLGKKLVVIVWETYPAHPAGYLPPYSTSIKEVVVTTDLFILRNQRALRFTDHLGIPRQKTKVIYKGVNLETFRPSGKRRSKSREALRILYVGQLVPSKGVKDLLEVFQRLVKEFPRLQLVIAGGGSLAGLVRRMARNWPIKYLGEVSYDHLPEVYRQADIFCSPSKDLKCLGIKIWEECFSYTLMEAQASGLPIVATECGGIPEEIMEGSGPDQPGSNFLVPQGKVEELYEALKKLIEDQPLRVTIGINNRKRAEKLFDLKKQAAETEKAILAIL